MSEAHDLEHLTQFAFDALSGLEREGASADDLVYALQYLKGACYTADAILRLHPGSCYYVPWGRQLWNPTSVQVLARVLVEACVNFHYFALSDEHKDEREFRFILANLHCVREREDSARQIESAGTAPPLIPDDWSGLNPEEQLRLLPWVKRRALPDAECFWRRQLAGNQHFARLSEAEQRKWLDGEGLSMKKGTYNGRRLNAGFSGQSVECRAQSAGVPASVFQKLQRQFSAHVHMAPHAVDQIRAFYPFDSIGRRSFVGFPTETASAALALAVSRLVELFPEHGRNLDPELAVLIALYPQVLARLDEETRRATDEATGEDVIGT